MLYLCTTKRRRKMVKRWTVGQSHFPGVVRRVPRVRPGAYPERTFTMSKKITTPTAPVGMNSELGWNCNTHLCVDVKTILHGDRTAKPGREYRGWLKRDQEEHFTFVEMLPRPADRHNPFVFDGRHISVTRRDDGRLRLNFKQLRTDEGFRVDSFALAVCNEIREALTGLVEE